MSTPAVEPPDARAPHASAPPSGPGERLNGHPGRGDAARPATPVNEGAGEPSACRKPYDSGPGKAAYGWLAGVFGLCCATHLIVLAGGFAVVFGNVYVIAAVLVLAAVAGFVAYRRRRGSSP
jgi:hypothetical protein